MKSALGYWLVGGALLSGCTRFHNQPLSPAHTAEQYEGRALSAPALQRFLSANLHRDLTNWPAHEWDLNMLSLAAFYWNPNLDVARAEWRVLAAGTETARERPNPTTTVSVLHEPVPGAPAPWVPTLLFDVPIETAGKRRRRIEQAQHLSDAARFNLAGAAWQVRSQVRSALVDDIGAQKRVALVQSQLALRMELVSRLQSQFQAGEISAIELNTARLALGRAQADLAAAQQNVAEARPRLAGALGVPAAALEGLEFSFDLSDRRFKGPLPPTLSPSEGEREKSGPLTPALSASEGEREQERESLAEMRRRALLGRTDLLSALADYAASQSALQLEISKQYPDLHLSPGYSWNAGSAGEHDWQIGVNVELPIFNRHRGPIAEAEARREASAAKFMALQAKVIGEIDTALASLSASRTNAQALDRLVMVQSAQTQATTQQFQAGALDRLDVLTAELELNSVELTRLDAQLKLQQAFGALEDAVQQPFELPPAFFQSTRSE